MTFLELIKEKNRRLETVPEKFLTSVEKYQKQLLSDIINVYSRLDKKNGMFVMSKDNLLLAESLTNELWNVMHGSDYIKAVAAFASEFEAQKVINNDYFNLAFQDFKESDFANAVLAQTKKNAVELLVGSTLKTNFLEPLRQQISTAVASGSSWNEIVTQLTEYATGTETTDGKLLRYTKEIASDTLAISDRAYTSAVSDDLGAEWFLYSGGILPTTRCFCSERNGKYFYYKEIESWGNGENLGDCNLGDGTWAGEMKDSTNAQTIYTTLGGWNCQHSIMPVSEFIVPADTMAAAKIKWGF